MTLQDQQRALARARAGEHAHHGGVAVAGPHQPPNPVTAAPTAGPPQRHGDRRSGDDDDGPRRLPVYVRFHDIQAAGIAGSWTQLNRLIDEEGFPVGCMLSPNIRAWKLAEVEAWLATRPTERKSVPDRWARRRAAATV